MSVSEDFDGAVWICWCRKGKHMACGPAGRGAHTEAYNYATCFADQEVYFRCKVNEWCWVAYDDADLNRNYCWISTDCVLPRR